MARLKLGIKLGAAKNSLDDLNASPRPEHRLG